MNCLPCFNKDEDDSDPSPSNKEKPAEPTPEEIAASSNAQVFNFRELAMATKNFRQESLLGEGGFGRVFKGKLHATGQVVAVKQLDRNGMQGNKEFIVEVLKLSLLSHPNLVNLIGYCADGDQRLLVYEYMPMGNLEQHLYGDGPEAKQLDWITRMKIASGIAHGLEYLHEKANPPVIYRDLKPSNVLLNDDLEPKLSDFGMSKLGAGGGDAHQTSRVMGTYGYSAPEYSQGGKCTLKSDVYSFGVLVLELITGRRAIDTTRPSDEQNLVTWAQPIFREPKRYPEIADPRLNKKFPVTSLNQAVGIAAMCLQEEPMVRPLISDIAPALGFICMAPNEATPPPEQKIEHEAETHHGNGSSEDESGTSSDSEEEKESERSIAYHSDDDSDGESGTEEESINHSDGGSSQDDDDQRSSTGEVSLHRK